MARRLGLNLASALTRGLGVEGPQLPGLSDGDVIPVAQVADVSRSLTAEVIEPRQATMQVLSTEADTGGPLGSFVYFSILCRAEGGMIIEDLALDALQFDNTWPRANETFPYGWVVGKASVEGSRIDAQPLPAGVLELQRQGVDLLQMGAIPGRCEVTTVIRDTNGAWPHLGAPGRYFLPERFQLAPGMRWYLAPGEQLWFIVNARYSLATATNVIAQAYVVWREVLSPL